MAASTKREPAPSLRRPHMSVVIADDKLPRHFFEAVSCHLSAAEKNHRICKCFNGIFAPDTNYAKQSISEYIRLGLPVLDTRDIVAIITVDTEKTDSPVLDDIVPIMRLFDIGGYARLSKNQTEIALTIGSIIRLARVSTTLTTAVDTARDLDDIVHAIRLHTIEEVLVDTVFKNIIFEMRETKDTDNFRLTLNDIADILEGA